MCVILAARKGIHLNKEELKEAFRSDSHGGGFTYVEDGKAIIKKGYFTFKDFWADYKDINGQKTNIVHFRWSTQSSRNKENCHPFEISESISACHNGNMPKYAKIQNGRSDSANFFEFVLKPLVNQDANLLRTPAIHALLSQALGDGNKIAILDAEKDDIILINDHLGHYHKDSWRSNQDYQKPKKKRKRAAVMLEI